MWNSDNSYLIKYLEEIKAGHILAGQDMIMELENLVEDIHSGEYDYDTRDAEIRIQFIEGCVKLTKAPYYGQPMKLMLWQKAFIEAVYSFKMDGSDRFQEILLLITRKNGKALALDTKIPTPDGWKTMNDIHVGDYVFTKSGKPSKVLAESEIFEKPMYRVTFEDGSVIDASEDHIWTVQTKASRRMAERIPEVRPRRKPEKFANDGWYDATTKELKDDFALQRKDGKGCEYKYRVPMTSAIEYPEKDLPLDPYTLGVWLGDGCKNHTGITCSDEDKDEMMTFLENEGHQIKFTKPNDKHAGTIWIDTSERWTEKENKTLKALKEIGVFKNKHIPEIYLQGSVRQRIALLQGLMDTDGTCGKNGECEFTQKSKEISLQVLELVRSLGIKASIKEKNAVCNGKDCGTVYRITFFTTKDFPCFRLKRKYDRLKDALAPRMNAKSIIDISEIEIRPSKCIAVEDGSHLYLAGDGFTCTHNTELIAAMQLAEMIIGGTGIDIVCSGTNDGTADLAYQAIDTMRLLIDPKSIDTWRNQKGIKCLANNNHIYKLSDSSRQKEGRNIDVAGIDEVWSLQDDGIYKPIQQSTSTKDNYKIYMFGSEGFVDGGFLDKKREEYTKIIIGEDDSDSSKRKLPWIYSQDSEKEVWNTNSEGINKAWEKSNPSIGVVKKWSYLRDRVDEARKSKADRIFTLCKDFNIKQASAESWLNIEDYTYETEYDPDTFKGCFALGAVDLAETTDLVAAKAMVMRPNDPRKYVFSHYFIPENKLIEADDKTAGAKYKEWANDGYMTITEGADVDLAVVADWFWSLYTRFGIKLWKCGYDQRFAKDWLKRMEYYGWDKKGNDEASDVVMIIQNSQTLNNAIKLTESEFRHKLIMYNNHPVDRWCFGNAGIKIDNNGCLIVKMDARKKIDGAVCLAILYEMYRRYRSDYRTLVER